ncbi:L-seryl-tRNA(Sec) selenium transferase [Fusobacterium sp.]|uniref:L-seryl-tRNA(Sec) selenium transferase n=1 Tax=Fusobacterium sp. TaxID=68766 RepID=UPI00396C757F
MQNLFRKLPKVDILMKDEKLAEIKKKISYSSFYQLITDEINDFRNKIKNREIDSFNVEDIIENIILNAEKHSKTNLKKVINGTGVIIHTNLGRSILNKKVFEQMKDIATHYNNLEYDISTGKRGNRNSHVEKLLTKLTGAESAIVVNNNAAAVIICLNEFAKNGNSIVSRGELVEIGGSFRIPDIMELSGTHLKEVGTTNKTHIEDYKNAIDDETKLILKVHTSNFKIVGFTKQVENLEIAELGKENNILTMEDLGSGVLVDFSKYGITKEPTVQESIASGIDLVTISGDKLLGGPQCGIILGRKELIDRLKKNPYLRAFRVDKLVLSALETTLNLYSDEREAIKEIPTLKMITENSENVLKKATALYNMLLENNIKTTVEKTRAKIGGGSMPEETVSSYAVRFQGSPEILEKQFREGNINIIGRISNDGFIIDLKTVFDEDIPLIVKKAITIKELF